MLLDDNVIAKMIFDESNHQISSLVSTPKSPMHKNASSLQDVTEIHKPFSPNPVSTHRFLSGSHSVAYPSPYQGSNSAYLSDSNRSFSTSTGLYSVDSQESFLRDYNRSPHGSATLPVLRYEDPIHRGALYQDDYRQPFTPNKSSSPNGTPYHKSHDPGILFQTHAAITIPQHPTGHRNSSPDAVYSPNIRNSFSSSRGTFSPEPPLSYSQVGLPRTRPNSTHSRGTTPPQEPFQNQRNPRGISYKEKEMDLQEALMMDQDEGTLV